MYLSPKTRSAVIRRARVSAPCWCRPALRAVAPPCALRGEPGCSSHGFCPSQGALRVDGSVCGSAVAAHQPAGARSSPLLAGSFFVDVRLPKRSTPRRETHYSLPLSCVFPLHPLSEETLLCCVKTIVNAHHRGSHKEDSLFQRTLVSESYHLCAGLPKYRAGLAFVFEFLTFNDLF